jgi:hypothetical protein
MTAKTRAIPSLHLDHFVAYRDSFVAVLRRVTQPPHIAGPLGFISGRLLIYNPLQNNFEIYLPFK